MELDPILVSGDGGYNKNQTCFHVHDLSCVSEDMFGKSSVTCESLLTEATLVWFLSGVGKDVPWLGKIIGTFKCLLTEVTLVW